MTKRLLAPWLKVWLKYCYNSIKEFLFLVIFSFMPVWLGALINYLRAEELSEYFYTYFTNGEALLLSATTIGPLMFVLVNEENTSLTRKNRIPFKWFFYLAITVVCVIAALLLGMRMNPPEFAKISASAMFTISVSISFASLLIWMIIVTTNAVQETGAVDVMRQDEQDFLNEYGGH